MLPSDFRALPNMALAIKKNTPLKVYGTGLQTRTFCYVTDAIAGFLKVLSTDKEASVYNIGNTQPEITMYDLAQIVCELRDFKAGIEVVPHPTEYPADEPQRRCPDISRAEKELGFKPIVQLRDGLGRFFDWAEANY